MVSTCTITGTMRGSDGAVTGGTIQVQARTYFADDSSTPDSVIFPTVVTINVSNTGAVNFTLPRTESKQVAYNFKITPTTGSYLEFDAVIPDAATVELASLIPTQYSTDRAATGALRIAKEMLTNASVSPYIISGLGLPKSSTPPSAPTSSDVIWIDSTTGVMHTWSAADSGWLSQPFSVVAGGRGFSSTSTVESALEAWEAADFIKLTKVIVRYEVVAAPNDTNRWVLQPVYWGQGSSSPTNAATVVNSNGAGYVVGTIRNVVLSPDSVLSTTAVQSVGMTLTKSGFPGNLNASVTFQFRNLRFPA